MKNLFRMQKLTALAACLIALVILWQIPAGAASASLDYGKEGDAVKTLSASELFDRLFGNTEELPLTEAEKNALDALSELSMQYHDRIPPQKVNHTYNGDTGVLTVRAERYVFTANNGVEVAWVPQTVSIHGGTPVPFDTANAPAEYICRFEELWNSEDIPAKVEYAWQVEIPVETANGLLTLPYTLAQDALAQLLPYEDYVAKEAAYQSYLEQKGLFDRLWQDYYDNDALIKDYQARKTAYEQYLTLKKEYDLKMVSYREYLKKLDAYKKQEADFYHYEQIRMENETLYDQYEAYLEIIPQMDSRLSIMESMFLKDSHGWIFYTGVMGSTVDSVIDQRYELETVGTVNRKYIDNAKNATDALRPLLEGYQNLRLAKYDSDFARKCALFGYYAENYEAIRDTLSLLYDSIHKIYSYSAVVTGMSVNAEAAAKQAHFRQFLAQLYILYCALNDTPVPDPAWVCSPYDKYSYTTLLDPELFLPVEINPSPAGITVPKEEIVLPGELPEPVPEPVKDFEDQEEPIAPAEKEDPGEEPEALDPPAMAEPTPVAPPTGEKPAEPSLSEEVRNLAAQLQAEALPKREERQAPLMLTLRTTLEKELPISNKKEVVFYDHNNQVIHRELVEYGATVTAPDVSRLPDAEYEYHHLLGWFPYGYTGSNLADRVSLRNVTADLYLIPKYESKKNTYSVTWLVDGREKTTFHHWGELPTCPLDTDKKETTGYIYTFVGWSPAVVAVTGNATYEAQYEKTFKSFTVTWVMGEKRVNEVYQIGALPVPPSDTALPPDDVIYSFTGWDREIRKVSGDITYTAQYQKTPLVTYNNGTAAHVEHLSDRLVVHAEHSVVCFTQLSRFAKENSKPILIKWGAFEVPLSLELLSIYEAKQCTKLELTQAKGDYEGCILFGVRHLNDRGLPVTTGTQTTVIMQNASEGNKKAMVYQFKDQTAVPIEIVRYADGRVQFSVEHGAKMEFRSEYQMTFTDPEDKCNLSSFPTGAPLGSQVPIQANCKYGYEISAAIVKYADGRQVTVTGDSFVMEADIVGVEIKVTPIVYHITFVVDGVVISEQLLGFGEKYVVPDAPQKAEDDLYTYKFEGWTPDVRGATTGANRNPVFTASFSREAKQSLVTDEEINDRFLTVVVPICSAVLALVITGVVLAICFRRRIKAWLQKKRGTAAENSEQEDMRGGQQEAAQACSSAEPNASRTITCDPESEDDRIEPPQA